MRLTFLSKFVLCLAAVPAWLLVAKAAPTAGPHASTTNSVASASLSLEALVTEVLRDNAELAFYREEVAAAKAGRKSAAQWSNPEITGAIGSKRVWERGGGATLGDGAAWSVSVAQAFEWPGRLALRKAIANGQITLAQLGLDQFRAALAARARSLGYSVLVAQEKAEAAAEVAGRFQALLGVLVQREPAGVTPVLDQRIVEAATITLTRRASQSAQALRLALIELNQLRGQPPTAPLRLAGTTVLGTNLPALNILLAAAATNNFDIRMREAELNQQGFRVQLSQNERWPKVTLAPFYSAETANDEQRIVGLEVTVPVPLWNRNKGSIEAAQARLQQAEASLRVACRKVERQVADHAVGLESMLTEMAEWRPDVQKQLREAAELADRHYRLGAVPVTTYIDMQLRYLDALEVMLDTRREALEHRQQLELLTGQPLAMEPAR